VRGSAIKQPDRPLWRQSLRRYDVPVFLLVTFAVTWVVWVPRALGVAVGVIGQLWTWMPALAALGCAALMYGRTGVRDLGRRLVLWRVRWWWYVVVLLGPFVFAMAVAGIAVLLGEPWNAGRPAALTWSVPALLLTLLLLALTDGLGEELGWRGYLLPRLLARYQAVTASLILGVFWWLWHLPLVWTTGAAIEGQPLGLLLADLLAKSLIFTYVFLGTQGSVLIAILLHASTNLFVVSPAAGPDGDLTVPLTALFVKIVLVVVLFARLPQSFNSDHNRESVIFAGLTTAR
jgi:membrane protease YdiL (CAAX protease family)